MRGWPERTDDSLLAIVGDYRAGAMDGCIVRFSTCASTVARRQGENGIVTTIPGVFDCDTLYEGRWRHMACGMAVAMPDIAWTLRACE